MKIDLAESHFLRDMGIRSISDTRMVAMPERLDSITGAYMVNPIEIYEGLKPQQPQDVLVTALTSEPHQFLQPSVLLHTDAIRLLKHTLDPIAAEVSTVQQQRLQALRRKRKRGDESSIEPVLRIKQIHSDGFSVDQVWEQARRVIDAARDEIERSYVDWRSHGQQNVESPSRESAYDLSLAPETHRDEDYEVGSENAEDSDEDIDVDMDMNLNGVDDYDDVEEDGGLEGLEELDENDDASNVAPAEEFVADKHGLNDGFFSIDDFNKRSEFLEQQDVRGEDDGAASDEEDIDWDADPITLASLPNGDGDENNGSESEDGHDEDGPTFGDPDASSGEEDGDIPTDGMEDVADMGNTNEIMYADFFAPPARKTISKRKKGRPNPHNFPRADTNPKVEADDMERTMAAVDRDLFEDDASEPESGDDERPLPDLDPDDPRSRKSAHERRTAALAEEIRQLEAANIAKRDWTLSGEARAADRPLNSLLEEDLDFERTGKPVPVITAEVSESIEDLIKRRILAMDFQDILRRRPDDLATGNSGRRGRLDLELDDSRSKKGLAEEYEEEYSKRTDPNYTDAQDIKLQKEQKEIESLWKDVCARLDSLSSWHFRPKAPTTSLEIRVDAPAIAMEDVRPSTGAEVAGASQLAPQELYKAGESTAKNNATEVAGKSGLPTAREELSREDKKRRRRREKERIRKGSGKQAIEDSKSEGKGGSKKQVLNDLKRGNVQVIGKKGDVSAVDGSLSARAGGQGAAQFKL